MAPRRGVLGRGLDALIAPPPGAPLAGTGLAPAAAATGARAEAPAGLLEVEIGRIEPNPLQPRRQVDDDQLAELADSIREHGLLQPLLVTQRPGPPGAPARYQLIAGERRWRAARLAGLTTVPVVVREAAGPQALELALVENIQRADLNPLEEATAYRHLAEEFGLTQEEIGQRVGKSRFAISNTLRLLQLPASVQRAILDGQLSEGHARALLGLRDRQAQEHLAEQVIARGLSVRQTEEAVRRALAQVSARRRPGRARPADVEELEARFREALGTRVSLSRSKRGGRLVIYYYDDEQLHSIYERLALTDRG
jgi:ParB family chromosome partitioning protein